MALYVGLLVFAAFATNMAHEVRVTMEPDVVASIGSAPSWNRQSRASATEHVQLIFMLKHDADKLRTFEQTLLEISTPGSSRYGQHLSKAQIAEQLPPVDGARQAVLTWLAEHGVKVVETSGAEDMIAAEISVQTAEAMFETTLHHFVHKTHKVDLIRATSSYSLPASVAASVYVVGNLVQLPVIEGAKMVTPDSSAPQDFPNGCGFGCRGKVTPDVLQQAYGLGTAPTSQNATMAVAEFQGVSWNQGDLNHFNKVCHPAAPVKVDHQVGKNGGLVCKIPVVGAELCLEALLDIQYIKSVAGDVPLTCISDLKYSLLNWAKQIATMDNAPLVHSVSYGNDEVQQTSTSYMDSVNAQFMKLGARGISILVASGDQGVYGRTGHKSDGKFHPDFPASSPYVTAVGGTDFAVKSVVGAEKSWSNSGGGFSNAFSAPDYQKDAVSQYLQTAGQAGVLPASSHFNSAGRGYPDVAALGGQQNPYCVAASLLIASSMTGVAGTSASCPVVAGIFARLNAIRAESGMSPMGFLNPFIYKNPDAFNDVSAGKNNANGPEGFTAIKGWDAATGLGTPNFPKLKDAAVKAALPSSTASIVV